MSENKYQLPDVLDDSEAIRSFIDKNSDKKIVAVQGLGFVGSVMSLVVANDPGDEYAVLGVDLPQKESFRKIVALNEGEFPLETSDEKVYELYERARRKENFYATYDSYAYSVSDVIIVDINLDIDKNIDDAHNLEDYDLSLDPFKKGIRTIAQNCRENALIIIETTVPPGTCEKVVQPIMDECFEERGLDNNYKLAHSYERVMPGPDYVDSIVNFYRVYAGIDEESADRAREFLTSIIRTDEYPLTRLHNTTASEMAKVLENSYRAMNIAFIQEWTEFAESAGVNLYEVIEAIRIRPTHKNIMRPGLGVGGYCLTKDPLLASWSRENLFDGEQLQQSVDAVKINDRMPLHAVRTLKDEFGTGLQERGVLLLGVSYRSEVGDTRNTPVELLYSYISQQGADITLHDPFVTYWPEQDVKVSSSLENVLDKDYDILILTTAHSEYRDNSRLTEWIVEKDALFVLDSNRVLSDSQVKEIRNHSNKLKIIGRGDI